MVLSGPMTKPSGWTVLPCLAFAGPPALAAAPSAPGGGWGWLPLTLALSVAGHLLLGRGLKALWSAVHPLAGGTPEAGRYERTVYGTPARAMHEVVALVLASGLLLWVAIGLYEPWLVALSLAVFIAALVLDLLRWERVSASADFVWFQRGLGKKLHQVDIENIRDLSVTEQEVGGFSFRHGRRNRVCRLNLRMNDKRIVALPKTDAHGGLASVEAVAQHIRKRQQLLNDAAARRRDGVKPAVSAPPAAAASPSQSEKDMLRALKRLRQQAAAAPAPPRLNSEVAPAKRPAARR